MLGIPFVLMTEQERQWRRESHEREVARRCPSAVPWSPDIKWEPRLTIQGATYPVRSLLPVEPSGPDVNACEPNQRVASPSGAFVYCEKSVPRGTKLQTIYGTRHGDVMFDAPVLIPALHEVEAHNPGRYKFLPWMSLTPMEMITLRAGTKRARGSVIVAGLGLGHQLIEVSRRKNVKRLTLVERSRELCDWLLPLITPHLSRPLDEIVVGDAYQEMPKLAADVALVDIFPGYGCNSDRRDDLRRTCPKIGFIWAWGAPG